MKNYTDINIVLDRSGSMASIANDMLGGLRSFVTQQQEKKDKANVSFYLFDDRYDVVFEEKSLDSIKDSDFTLVPRGWTALVDALGKTINSVGERLSNMKEDDRPNRVLFVVITDGEDNRSREFALEKVKDMVQHQREVYAWDFVFLGANIDSFATGKRFGIVGASTSNFEATPLGVSQAFQGLNESYASYSLLDRSVDRCSTFSWNRTPAENKETTQHN